MPDLATPAAGRDQWLRCAAACLANDPIDRNLWIALAADCYFATSSSATNAHNECCTESACLKTRTSCGTAHARSRSHDAQEKKEEDARLHGVARLLDPGSNAHLTNVRGVLKPGSIVPCYVEVQGLSGGKQKLIAKEKGVYVYEMGENERVCLYDVLFVPDAVIGSTVNEPMVLVSSGRMAKACDVGTHFVAGGDRVEFVRDDHVVGGFDTSTNCGLYIDRTGQTDKARERQRLVALCASVLFGLSDETHKQTHTQDEKTWTADMTNDDEDVSEKQHDEKADERENEYEEEKDKESMKTYEAMKKEKKERRKTAKENKRKYAIKKEKDTEKGNAKERQANMRKPQMSKREREVLLKKLHARLHFGKTRTILNALKNAYGIDFVDACALPCDACQWAKAKHSPVSKASTRKAVRVGGRLHYDVFTAGARSDSGCKYMLIVVDEFSDHVWCFGLRKKSETSEVMKALIVELEKQMSRRVQHIVRDHNICHTHADVLPDGVAALRSDNAGENINDKMKKWCRARGTAIETTIPHTPHQNGKAERVGGVVWQGGAALRYGGNLPYSDWLHCCQAFTHMRNRLPTTASGGKRTPHEILNGITLSVREQIDHFRTLGCLCYVVKAHGTRKSKQKVAWRGMMMGYAECDGQKGYKIRRLSDGQMINVARERVARFYEFSTLYPREPDYDAWLQKQLKESKKDMKERETKYDESESEDTSDTNNDESENQSDTSDDESEAEMNIDGENGETVVVDGASAKDDETCASHERESDHEGIVDSSPAMDMLAKMELGMPPLSPLPPLITRSHSVDDDSENDRDSSSVSGGESGVGDSLASMPAPAAASQAHRLGSISASEALLETSSDDSSNGKPESSDDEEGEYEVDSILRYRRVGRKRGNYEYLTKWVGGEETWEPSSSFKLDAPDVETHSHFLPVYDDYKTLMKEGKALEWDEEMSIDGGETMEDGPSSAASLHDDVSDEMKEEIRQSMMNRIRVLKTIVKAGIEVPDNRRKAMKHDLWPEFYKAERVELDAFDEFGVWELVPCPANANVVGVRWVYDVKMDEHGNVTRHKARLVAQGFSQKEGIDYNETFAPTMHIKTARLLLAIAARDNVAARQYDVSTAFLHADLKETVYVRQPEGHRVQGKESCVYRLRKAMYGLKNAPKAYSDFFMKVLSELGFVQSTQDECLWALRKGKSYVYYLFHVDDILCVSNDVELREACFLALARYVKIRDEGEVSLFLGMEIKRMSDGGYTMSQQHYIERMAKRFNIGEDAKPARAPAAHGKMLVSASDAAKAAAAKLPYQALLGCLIYCAKTRPDVAYAISDAARFMSCWDSEHFNAAMRILRYLYATRERCLHIRHDVVFDLYAYSDANWSDPRETSKLTDDKYKAQYGFVVSIAGCLLSWTSRRQQSRAQSSMESEFYAACEATKEVVWWRALMKELGLEQEKPTVIYEDNKACISYSKNNTCHARTKHIDLKAHACRDYVRDGVVKLVHVSTDDQLADMMTKTQSTNMFVEHVSRLFEYAHTAKPKRVAKVKCCECITCFVSHDVCQKSVMFDPVLSFDPGW